MTIGVVSEPADLGTREPGTDPFYIESLGETCPFVDTAVAEAILASALSDAKPVSRVSAPAYEYWWTVGHPGLPFHDGGFLNGQHACQASAMLRLWRQERPSSGRTSTSPPRRTRASRKTGAGAPSTSFRPRRRRLQAIIVRSRDVGASDADPGPNARAASSVHLARASSRPRAERHRRAKEAALSLAAGSLRSDRPLRDLPDKTRLGFRVSSG